MDSFNELVNSFNAFIEKYTRDVKCELNPAAKEFAVRVLHTKQKLDEAMDEIEDLVDDFSSKEIEENIDVDTYVALQNLEDVLNYYR